MLDSCLNREPGIPNRLPPPPPSRPPAQNRISYTITNAPNAPNASNERLQVDLGLRNKNGETALMCAARFGSKQVVRLLLEHLRHLEMDCFFLRQRNRFGLTPLEIARTENLEAAKVLTKHLIAYGQHTGSVLARSVSHHQLAADYAYRPAVPVAAGRRRRHNAAELLAADECLSASDYDSDILALPPARMPARPGRRLAATAAYGPYYDPKAAEFSQYLLDQQVAQESGELAGYGPAGGAQRAAPSRAAMSAMSDDDEDYGPAGGPLVRSRSCMLGPRAVAGGGGGAAGAGHSKSGAFATRTAANKKAAEQSGAGEMAASWQERATGAAGPAQ